MPSSLGPAEVLVILIVALIVLGPAKLPQAGRQLGRALGEFRRWSQDMKDEVTQAFDAAEEPPRAPEAGPDPAFHSTLDEIPPATADYRPKADAKPDPATVSDARPPEAGDPPGDGR